MSLRALPRLLRADPVIAELLGSADSVVAVAEAARAFVLGALATLSSAPVVLVATPTGTEAERLAHDLRAFADADRVEVLPAWETLPFERVSPSVETMGRRLRAMWHLRRGAGASASADADADAGADPQAGSMVLVASVKSLLQRLGPRVEDTEPITVRRGESVDLDAIVGRLVAAGYRREYQVEHRGEIAVRGGIVDVFPSTGDTGIRIDLFGDEVDRLAELDLSDQRSVRDLEQVEIFACRELLITPDVAERARRLASESPYGRDQFERIAEGLVFDGMESWLPWLAADEHVFPDLLGPEDRIVLVDPRRMRDRASDLLEEEASLADALATTWMPSTAVVASPDGEGFPRLHVPFERMLARCGARLASMPPTPDSPDTPILDATGWPAAHGDPAVLARRLGELHAGGYRVLVCADGEGSALRIGEVLASEGVSEAEVVVQPLDRGFVLPAAKLAVLAEPDLTGRRRPHRKPRPRPRLTAGFFDDLAPGGYVVHHVHGVARYGGMVTRSIGGAERDYLLLEYRGDDRLYVPSDQIDSITPYTGGEQPTLSRLGGADWQRTKARVRSAVREIAQELVVLYQRRISEPGHAFPPDTPWQIELEQSFPYVETPDQAKAIGEVKADMELPAPMDRLVCGDVGFGKTEVAVRAVFKAVQDGFQAAVLVPTTLLAQQHFATFSERFAPFPVRVEMLSRFLTAGESAKVAAGLADGSVDVVVGTHRLLSGDIRFRKLGLLVVDEEQRFGVTHKEQLKQIKAGVDVVTLTASPIPRTLEMSLTGIRDLSLIDTPPSDRQPILTYVGEYDERAVSEALRRELLREGQAFFVHNRVHDIERVAAGVRDLVPEARVAVAHGQMDEGTLEQVVLDFSEGRYDVLVCTTIIESGIDMPTVNTLVVDRADLLGLGQLHQLRGRVGRAGQRAYAYLLYPPDRVLTEEAYERLRTIGERTELGSGFRIAIRDLEIRGAGNLLGRDQSGHIAAVGYDLYVKMVAEAVAELKGEVAREPAEIKLDLAVKAFLPSSYVEREDLRLEAYRRLAAVTTEGEVDDIRAEWLDRYGPLPDAAEALISVARLRAECSRTGVKEVTVVPAGPGSLARRGGTARLSPLELRASARVRLERRWPKAIYKEEARQLVFPLAADGTASGRASAAAGAPAAPASAAEVLAEVLRELVPAEVAAAGGSAAS